MGLLQGDNQDKIEHQQKVQKHLQSNYVYANVSIDNDEHIIQFLGNITIAHRNKLFKKLYYGCQICAGQE